tara:strand:+ start:554 stop:817 length:264 start_codon:yes stop_codon:yes gene_type:complete
MNIDRFNHIYMDCDVLPNGICVVYRRDQLKDTLYDELKKYNWKAKILSIERIYYDVSFTDTGIEFQLPESNNIKVGQYEVQLKKQTS